MNLTQVSSLVCVCVSMYVFQPKDQHLNYLETLEHLLRKWGKDKDVYYIDFYVILCGCYGQWKYPKESCSKHQELDEKGWNYFCF